MPRRRPREGEGVGGVTQRVFLFPGATAEVCSQAGPWEGSLGERTPADVLGITSPSRRDGRERVIQQGRDLVGNMLQGLNSAFTFQGRGALW